MSLDVISIEPRRLRFKLADASDMREPVWPGDWDVTRRLPLDASEKHVSVVQRYQEGRRWEDTDLFKHAYRERLATGERVRGCETLGELARQYYDRVDALFAHLKEHGFQDRVDGTPVKIPDVFLGRDGEVILSNDGNHRVAMAKIINLSRVLVKVRTRHPLTSVSYQPVRIDPVLHDGAISIPAMTTPAEQWAGYLLAKEHATRGAMIELGAWLGAMSVYLAAGIRDSDTPNKLHVYDRFVWKPVHTVKAGGPLTRSPFHQFMRNMGPLAAHMEVYSCDFRDAVWTKGPIGLMVLDGPKRVKEITRTLPIFGPSLVEGARLALQDFAHFASYDLPASFDILEKAGVVRWESAVYPGTMSIFEVLRPITADDVNAKRLQLDAWSPDAIEETWDRWAARLPEGQRPRFRCGAALFLCDRAHGGRGAALFRKILHHNRDDIAAKWTMIRQTRPEFALRYPTLDAEMGPWNH